MNKNDRGRTEAILTLAIEANPNSPSAHLALANFYLDYPKPWEAVKDARIARALDPKRIDPFTVQALAFAELEQRPALEATLRQAEQDVPDDFYPYYATGRALRPTRKGRPPCVSIQVSARTGMPNRASSIDRRR
jgi:tetratricopeptide (TPR) repeat protein